MTCVSADLEAGLREAGLPAARLRVVPNSVAVPTPPAAAELARVDAELGLGGAPVVIAVGRLVAQKNHARFLAAAARVGGDAAGRALPRRRRRAAAS